ncbi:MAG TPA: alginate export family protein [Gemmataceae bacterium]|nr:alginate export family protein [Gemmataceae bacterium]
MCFINYRRQGLKLAFFVTWVSLIASDLLPAQTTGSPYPQANSSPYNPQLPVQPEEILLLPVQQNGPPAQNAPPTERHDLPPAMPAIEAAHQELPSASTSQKSPMPEPPTDQELILPPAPPSLLSPSVPPPPTTPFELPPIPPDLKSDSPPALPKSAENLRATSRKPSPSSDLLPSRPFSAQTTDNKLDGDQPPSVELLPKPGEAPKASSPDPKIIAPAPDAQVPKPDGPAANGTSSIGAAAIIDPANSGCDPLQDKALPSYWLQVPPVEPMPRPGDFAIEPCRPGYYSFKDIVLDRWRQQPPPSPWLPYAFNPNPFFNADFRYLDCPNYDSDDWLDGIKRIHLGECDDFLFTPGGEFRYRFMSEDNSRLVGTGNDYHLLRARAYGDFWYQDLVRFYSEFIFADSYGQSLPPLANDANRADILNMFVDLNLMNVAGNPLTFRVGRQELLYGSQRLISTWDWVNSPRTFDGIKGFWHSCYWDIDLFAVRPVIVNPTAVDGWDDRQAFTGAWATYKPKPGTAWDIYLLNLTNSNQVFVGQFGTVGGMSVTTMGTRLAGDINSRWLYDFEGMYQTGLHVNQDIVAGSATAGLGYRAKDMDFNPIAWVYFDWASGDQNPGSSHYNTFNQLFADGHWYFGYNDFVGRQNIMDLHLQLSANPMNWILVLMQYHRFWLASPRDGLYNAAGTLIRVDPTGNSGNDVGQELDWFVNFHLSQHQDLMIGYSRFFAGPFIQNTGFPGGAGLAYGQYTFKW